MSEAGSDYGGAGEAYEYEAEEDVNMNEDEMQALQEERELHQAGANGNHIEVLPLVRLQRATHSLAHFTLYVLLKTFYFNFRNIFISLGTLWCGKGE